MFKKSLQLRLSLWIGLSFLGLALIMISYAAYLTRQEASAKAREHMLGTAQFEATELQKKFNEAMGVARAFKATLIVSKKAKTPLTREQVIEILKGVLELNPNFLGTYTLWEPNAYDGKDSAYVSKSGHDETGRFIPYLNRGRTGKISLDPIVDYETPELGDFYLIPKRLKREVLIDPYRYMVQGENVFMTSMIAPIVIDNKFLGMAGVDFRLDFLQGLTDKIQIYQGRGEMILVSHGGMITGATRHPELIGSSFYKLFKEDSSLGLAQRRELEDIFDIDEYLYAITSFTVGESENAWAVVIRVPKAEIYGQANTTIQIMIAAMLAFFVLGMGLIMSVFRTLVVEKIHALASLTKDFARGDYKLRSEVSGEDELGELSHSFNEMANHIETTHSQLSQSRQHLSAILNNTGQLFGLLTVDGRLRDANRSALDLIGMQLKDVQGGYIWELPWWRHESAEQEKIFLAVSRSARGETVRFETTHLDKEERVRFIEFSLTPLSFNPGEISYLVAEGHDITAKREEENRRLESEARYREILDHAPLAIFQQNAKKHYEYANPRALRDFGCSSMEQFNEYYREEEVYWANLLELERFKQKMSQAGKVADFEAQIRLPRGEVRWFSVYYYVDKALKLTNGFALDITAKKLAEKERLELLERYRLAKISSDAANRAKSTFLWSVSHEMRTPLHIFLGAAQELKESSLSGNNPELFKIMNSSGENLLSLINTILDMAKIESGSLEIEKTHFDLRETLENLMHIFKLKAEDKNLKILSQWEEGLPSSVSGDVKRFKQILMNLLANAIKFTDRGEIILTVKRGQDHFLKFFVRDTGIGIEEWKMEQLFKPFSQVDRSISRKAEGTGLGLHICKELVELMGGSISVKSEHGKGTEFMFELPLLESQEKTIQPLEIEGETIDPSQIKLKILFADDSEENVVLMKNYFKKTQCELAVAYDGEEAVELFKKGSYDLVLLDIQMPRMNGYQAATAMRTYEKQMKLNATKIFSLSAHTFVEDQKAAYDAGCNHCLSKPLSKQKLFEALNAVMKGRL